MHHLSAGARRVGGLTGASAQRPGGAGPHSPRARLQRRVGDRRPCRTAPAQKPRLAQRRVRAPDTGAAAAPRGRPVAGGEEMQSAVLVRRSAPRAPGVTAFGQAPARMRTIRRVISALQARFFQPVFLGPQGCRTTSACAVSASGLVMDRSPRAATRSQYSESSLNGIVASNSPRRLDRGPAQHRAGRQDRPTMDEEAAQLVDIRGRVVIGRAPRSPARSGRRTSRSPNRAGRSPDRPRAPRSVSRSCPDAMLSSPSSSATWVPVAPQDAVVARGARAAAAYWRPGRSRLIPDCRSAMARATASVPSVEQSSTT